MLVLRKGVDAELSSTVSDETYQIIRRLPGIATTTSAAGGVEAGEPMVSPEAMTVVNLPSVDNPEGMNVSVRGMLPIGLAMRTVTVDQGKMFTPGLRQVVVGDSVAKRYPNARLGQQVRFGRGTWEVVGVFHAGDSAANSEIWADLNQLRGDFERAGGSSSLLVRLDVPAETAAQQIEEARRASTKEKPVTPAFLKPMKDKIDDDQRLSAHVIGEKEYYASLTSAGAPMQVLGFSVSVIMAIGSAFAATNTMYAAVARRSREIGTLRALGFGRFSILLSFMLESICLALLGGLLGVLITLPVNGFTTGVGSFATFSETAFKFRITPGAVLVGLMFAGLIGAIGGFLPAYAASRKGIVAAMRDI